MCGISGFVSFKQIDKDRALSFVGEMNEYQKDRGPDDSGVFVFDSGAFGHRRLSIIDLSRDGHQPMIRYAKNGKRIAVTFNGEIYNFLELKKELENAGIDCQTQSDTEIILAGYELWGIGVLDKLRGMFAFALFDEADHKVFLARDRYGIKPLYYFLDKDKLVFASSVGAIENSGSLTIEKDINAKIGLLLFGSVPSPYTTVKNIFSVLSGTFLEVDLSGESKMTRYYNPLDFYANKNSYADRDVIIKTVRNMLEDAVKLHLLSDVSLGVFLSGGLDSSVISAMAQNVFNMSSAKNRLSTLSVIFNESAFSEEKYQNMVVEKIKSDHKAILVTKESFQGSLSKIWEVMDQPTIDGANSYVISDVAKKSGLKVVLSGLGSDEIFLGYANFKKAKLVRVLQLLPDIIKIPLLFIVGLLRSKYKKLSYIHSKKILNFYLAFRGIFLPNEVAKILGVSEKEVNDFISKLDERLFSADYKLLKKLHPADLMSYLDLTLYMQNQLLKDTDTMSMAHSIEVRVPFLDHKFVEYITSLPVRVKLMGKRQKQLLIDAVENDIPREVWDRKKMGFTFPLKKWISESYYKNESGHSKDVNGGHWYKFWTLYVLKRF